MQTITIGSCADLPNVFSEFVARMNGSLLSLLFHGYELVITSSTVESVPFSVAFTQLSFLAAYHSFYTINGAACGVTLDVRYFMKSRFLLILVHFVVHRMQDNLWRR